MSRTFLRSGGTYLSNANAIITAEPLSMAAWFRPTNIVDRLVVMGIGDESSERAWHIEARGNAADDPVYAWVRGDSGTTQAITTTGYTGGTWYHACCVFESDTSRAAYINGGSKGTDTTDTGLVSNVDVTFIGAARRFSSTANGFTGSIAEAAIWNVALTDADAAILAKGYSPLFVRPENLVAYWPLIRDTDIDRVGGYNMTAYNTPTIDAHPPIIYPVRPHIITAPAAAPGGLPIPVAMYQYRQRRV